MTVDSLYVMCGNIYPETLWYIIDCWNQPKDWGRTFSELSADCRTSQVGSFQLINDQVIVWLT